MFGGIVHNCKIDIFVSKHFLNRFTSNHPPGDVHFVELHVYSHSFDQYIYIYIISIMELSFLQ
jgi:hypothetical protein